ncbi:MAG: peptide ABC transporter ATP-binding protein [Chlamydiae bacterium CG10_big_fil_rev_8_21_14_0_10_42_34]|nr:MAG: peptide ABC transporter ATP-binding protein [Chlamydiae bacterium CG10_big_fil_rev_8_21_14_0_10_42_34]
MNPLLTVKDLLVSFSVQGQLLQAVRGVSFELLEGESVGIVGESGCGKSAAVQAISGLTEGKVSGLIEFAGTRNLVPGKEIGMIFQDPMSSLNPTMKIGAQISEGLIYHKMASKKEAKHRAIKLLDLVGIKDAHLRANQYPHQFSGGMRQRVLIATALACNPRLLIADEPTTALDTATQQQILDLIQKMKDLFKMSLLIISHDFNVIAKTCEKVLVMYAGKIIERGSVQEVLQNPRHPYTQMLLGSRPRLDKPKSEPLSLIEGAPPNLLAPIKGCAFQQRCPLKALKCSEEPPGPIACWRVQ